MPALGEMSAVSQGSDEILSRLTETINTLPLCSGWPRHGLMGDGEVWKCHLFLHATGSHCEI
jgi:hypothetical protein